LTNSGVVNENEMIAKVIKSLPKGLLLGVFFLISLGGIIISRGDLLTTSSAPSIISPLFEERAGDQSQTYLVNRNYWQPLEGEEQELANIYAQAYLSVDLGSGRVLFAKNHHQRLSVASLVKVMTALVALDHAPSEEMMRVSPRAAAVGEDSIGLEAGEILRLNELLFGLILVSGNDAAETISEGVGGRREVFIHWMNTKAKELGLQDTYFVNPTGLMEQDEKTGEYRAQEYSTASDLAVISYAFLQEPLLKSIAMTPEYFIPTTESHKAYYLFSQTNLLTTDERVKGLKMGYTPEAGLCGITYAQDQGGEILGVVLNTPLRRDDLKSLLDQSFAALGI
jgi:D-alanyl-D-alanine carboxypeptidase (penicillin-binding protein 5/6)